MKRLIAFIAFTIALGAHAEPVSVAIDDGELLGMRNDGIAVFKGIPYAAPPTGVRRWRAPEAPAAWQGVRLATQFSPQCEQLPYPENSMFTRPSMPASEDCLYLNVWSADLEPEKPSAVMVWIHGGGLTRGTGATSIYDGSNLARKGVVVVTINYRLGPFAYLAHPELSAEAERLGQARSSGNYGTLDQVAALRWVQENIDRFGGDRNRVTIFGESAGSWSVNHMTATPLAAGLFHRAIGQSGAKFDPMPELDQSHADQPSAEATGTAFAQHVGAKSLAELRRLSAAEVIAGFETFSGQGLSQPNVDGFVFPDHIARLFAEGKYNRVDLIVGSNADEGTNLMPPPADAKAAGAFIDQAGRSRAGLIKATYGFDDAPAAAYYGFFRDMVFTWNMREWARQASRQNDSAYLYYFTFAPPGPMQEQLGAYHAAEIRYAFDNEHMTFDGAAATAAEVELGDAMSDYWVSFAKTGVPKSARGDAWPRYDADAERYLEIGDEIRAREGGILSRELETIELVVEDAWARREAAKP